MNFLAANWLWILFIVGFVAMHLTGHGCCGGHGSHAGHRQKPEESPEARRDEPQAHVHQAQS